MTPRPTSYANRPGFGWLLLAALLVTLPASASLWEDGTASTIGTTGEWSNKVELADLDGDGLVDILFANGGDYASAGTPEMNRVFINQGPGQPFMEIGADVFGKADSARVIKVRDLNADGVPDIVVGTTWQSRSRLFFGLGAREFVEVTKTHTPAHTASVGDVAIGDVDGDGDLDLVLSDWGAGSPASNDGGITRLWLNNGNGAFADATDRMPQAPIRWSWELELADVDNDFDLDVLVSCKSCSGSALFLNDGSGQFTDASEQLPQFGNNYDFEVMDIDGDGDVDLATINDGAGLGEHLFVNDGTGTFTDESASLLPKAVNIGEDDNMAAFLDYDNDGDADLIIGSLSGADRLLVNDGNGAMSLIDDAFSGADTPGTLGIAIADLDGDTRPDVVQAQGEVADPDKVFFGVDVAIDSTPPTLGPVDETLGLGELTVHLRVHDRKTPVMPHDFQAVVVNWSVDGGKKYETPLQWYGEALWRTTITDSGAEIRYEICARDAAENESCTAPRTLDLGGEPPVEPGEDVASTDDTGSMAEGETIDAGGAGADAGSTSGADAGVVEADSPGSTDSDSGGCQAGAPHASFPASLLLWGLAAIGLVRRRWSRGR